MGRPKIEITDEQLRQASLLAGYGLTQDQIADVLGIGHSTFRRKKDEPRVKSALEKGRAQAQHEVGKSIYERALNGDMTAAIWWEKTRAGRSERIIQAHETESVEIHIGRAAPAERASEANGRTDKDRPTRRAKGDTRNLRAV